MPKPPQQEDFFELKFVTNYLLAGCFPPYDLIVECSQEPKHDLLMLILGLDAGDIAQAMFDPRHGRTRKPDRHGRKRKRRFRFPDVNDMTGEMMRVNEVAEAGAALPGARFAFRALNFYESFTFPAALAGGLTDLGFETLWGVMNIDHDECLAFDRMDRQMIGESYPGFPGPANAPIALGQLNFNHGFFDGEFGTGHGAGPWALSFSARITNPHAADNVGGKLTLNSNFRGRIGETQNVVLDPGGSVSLSCSATCTDYEFVEWNWTPLSGTVLMDNARATAYGEVSWLKWAGL